MNQYLSDKVIPKIIKFINTKGVQSIKNGMVYSMPLLIIGSVFLILSNFPVQAVVDFWKRPESRKLWIRRMAQRLISAR